MDVVLGIADKYFFTPYVYPSSWREDNAFRQSISLYITILVLGYLIYFVFTTISYFLIFEQPFTRHPSSVEAEVKSQIIQSCVALPLIVLPSTPLFLLEVRGHSYLYSDASETSLGYVGMIIQSVTFLLFTDVCVYCIHRGFHHKSIYKFVHKHHHSWKNPTPFAGHAVHPLDGFLQMMPYHLYTFIFPLHKGVFVLLLVFVNIWTVFVHNGNCPLPGVLKYFVNGARHHTEHHLYFNYNYGHFFTVWDKIWGSYRLSESNSKFCQ